jgi:hypothetical protein
MSVNGKLKSSAALRDELVGIDTVLEATKQDEAVAHTEIRSFARLAVQPDQKDALARIKACEGRLGQAKMTHRRLLDAKAEVEGELCLALAEEDQAARQKDASEAEKFAEGLGNLFSEVDRHLADFRRSYATCFASIREARARGWSVPSEELMTAKMNRALKTAFSVGELRAFDMAPLPSPERCTFGSIGEAYARAILGGAKHSVLPSPTTQQAVKSEASSNKLPVRGDVGTRFSDDPKEFEIRVPTGR